MRVRNKIFVSVSCGFILLMMLFTPSLMLLESAGAVTTEKMGNIIEPSKVYEDDFPFHGLFNGIENGKAAIEDTYINYLPFYANIVTTVKNTKIKFNQPVNDILSKLAEKTAQTSVQPDAADTADVLQNPDEADASDDETTAEVSVDEMSSADGTPHIVKHSSKFLTNSGGTNFYAVDAEYSDGEKVSLVTLALSTSEKVQNERMKKQIELVNGISDVCEELGVNVYFYACSRFQDGEFFEEYVPNEKSLKPKVDEFFSSLSPYIRSGRLKVDTLEESIEKLFLTDHHWNAYGMYEAYCDIVNLMRADSPSIAEPREIGELHVIDEAEFYGTNARTSGYYECSDVFSFYDYDLPAHTLKATYEYSFRTKMKQYLGGLFEKKLSTDHYVNFYPYTEYMKYENSTGRNVLVLGDSYSRGISELLGSSFDETYIFDYRRIGEIGKLRKYVEEHNITDVLFMQYSLRGIFDNQGDNTLQLIRLN